MSIEVHAWNSPPPLGSIRRMDEPTVGDASASSGSGTSLIRVGLGLPGQAELSISGEQDPEYDRVYYNEDDGAAPPQSTIMAGINSVLDCMASLEVARGMQRADLPAGTNVWRYAMYQDRDRSKEEAYVGTSGLGRRQQDLGNMMTGEGIRVLLRCGSLCHGTRGWQGVDRVLTGF